MKPVEYSALQALCQRKEDDATAVVAQTILVMADH